MVMTRQGLLARLRLAQGCIKEGAIGPASGMLARLIDEVEAGGVEDVVEPPAVEQSRTLSYVRLKQRPVAKGRVTDIQGDLYFVEWKTGGEPNGHYHSTRCRTITEDDYNADEIEDGQQVL